MIGNNAARPFNGLYRDGHLDRIAFPLGGMGAGMFCLEGNAKLSNFSLRHEPNLFSEPLVFAAIAVTGPKPIARVLEGPVQDWKIQFPWAETQKGGSGNGGGGKTYGLPRFAKAEFNARFPFGEVSLSDPSLPIEASVKGWSPFVPGDADNSSLPAAAVEYRLKNTTGGAIEGVFTFNAENFMGRVKERARIDPLEDGFVLRQEYVPESPEDEGAFCVRIAEGDAVIDPCWFRGDWFDALTVLWERIRSASVPSGDPVSGGGPGGPGASIFKAFRLPPGGERVFSVLFSWYVPRSSLRTGTKADFVSTEKKQCGCAGGTCAPEDTYRPWYASRFPGIRETADYWMNRYQSLKNETETFSKTLYGSTLPPEVLEAVGANLSILKSPTVLRQADGRLWAWEGCCDRQGCCAGTCTHVWNYAQAVCHLFPALERKIREAEFSESQNEAGHQTFRAPLPLRPAEHEMLAAADGQLGGIIKAYRDWRISGDSAWIAKLWSLIKTSMEYCVKTWDPEEKGIIEEPHHNTYDIEFWGPDGMTCCYYLGALRACAEMAEALNGDPSRYRRLYEKGRAYLEGELFNGEYFFQRVKWTGLKAADPSKAASHKRTNYDSPEAMALLRKEGPKYQYGTGCLSDGIVGAWLAKVCGMNGLIDPEMEKRHVASVFKYNFRESLLEHENPQRPTYALGGEGGLLLCSWPKGGRPTLPFVYSNEVWTGIEYEIASHLIMVGKIEEGLLVVRTCRSRYDGQVRNPFSEYECGHWYARALSSFSLLQALSGASYDARTGRLSVEPRMSGDFSCFLAFDGGYGTVGVEKGKPFFKAARGELRVESIRYVPFGNTGG